MSVITIHLNYRFYDIQYLYQYSILFYAICFIKPTISCSSPSPLFPSIKFHPKHVPYCNDANTKAAIEVQLANL